LKNRGWEVNRQERVMKGVKQTKEKCIHSRDALKNLFEHKLKYK
jgi:hypothetical protein